MAEKTWGGARPNAGRKSTGRNIRVTVSITDHTRQVLQKIGKGNISDGIEKLVVDGAVNKD